MRKIDEWMLCGVLGLIAAGCGSAGHDLEGAPSDPQQLTKTTVVRIKKNGERETKTYFATPEQIEAEEQQRLAAMDRIEQRLAPDIIETSCSDGNSVWAYDATGAGSQPGPRCCLISEDQTSAWAYVEDVCGFTYMMSLRSGNIPGAYEASTLDCRVHFPKRTRLTTLGCDPATDWIYLNHEPPHP
jgi:hypothetical protein